MPHALKRTLSLALACGAAALAACSGGGGGGTPSTPSPTFSPVTVNDSGSTNTDKYSMVVHANDAVTITDTNHSTQQVTTTNGNATPASVTQLYTDLNANLPVSSLATTQCNKSPSFGSATTLAYDGSSSGDISCYNPPATHNVYNDVTAIEQQFNLPLS